MNWAAIVWMFVKVRSVAGKFRANASFGGAAAMHYAARQNKTTEPDFS
jgi:hypothetical protein